MRDLASQFELSNRPGHDYWNEIRHHCCDGSARFTAQRKVTDSRLRPAHINFIRLARLYGSGGLWLGFSLLLLKVSE